MEQAPISDDQLLQELKKKNFNCPQIPDGWRLVFLENPLAKTGRMRSALFEHAVPVEGQADKDRAMAAMQISNEDLVSSTGRTMIYLWVRKSLVGATATAVRSCSELDQRLREENLPDFPILQVAIWVRNRFENVNPA